jgi:dephospho-CoA kinase
VEASGALRDEKHETQPFLICKQLSAYLAGHWAVVLDVPLLFEGPMHLYSGTVLVVGVSDPKLQMQRLRARDAHLSAQDAENRVLSQGDVREKAARARARGSGRGAVVWNDGDREELRREVDRVMDQLHRQCPQWWTWMCLLCPPLALTSAAWALLRNRQLDAAWRGEQAARKARL